MPALDKALVGQSDCGFPPSQARRGEKEGETQGVTVKGKAIKFSVGLGSQ